MTTTTVMTERQGGCCFSAGPPSGFTCAPRLGPHTELQQPVLVSFPPHGSEERGSESRRSGPSWAARMSRPLFATHLSHLKLSLQTAPRHHLPLQAQNGPRMVRPPWGGMAR